MTSDKSYDNALRLDALVPRVGTLEGLVPGDTMHDMGTMTAGWSKATGFIKYTLLLPGVVGIAIKDLQCTGATVTDGTTIVGSGQGLPSGYQPATNKTLVAYCDVLRIVSGSNNEAAALRFINDGSIQCVGIAASATIVSCYGLLFINV